MITTPRVAPEIDAVNDRVFTQRINNGVYKSGFATTQDALTVPLPHAVRSLDLGRGAGLAANAYLTGTAELRPTGGCEPRCSRSILVLHLPLSNVTASRITDHIPKPVGLHTRTVSKRRHRKRSPILNHNDVRIHFTAANPINPQPDIIPSQPGRFHCTPHGRDSLRRWLSRAFPRRLRNASTTAARSLWWGGLRAT